MEFTKVTLHELQDKTYPVLGLTCGSDIFVRSSDDEVASVFALGCHNNANFTLQILPHVFGSANASIFVNQTLKQVIMINVLRNEPFVKLLFSIVLSVLITLYNVGFGARLDIKRVKEVVLQGRGPFTGICCQFGVMPTLSLLFVVMFRLEAIYALGLLIMGACPGGGGSNVFAYLFNADLELSITMTALSTIVAIPLTPLIINFYSRFVIQRIDANVMMPLLPVVGCVAAVLIPIGVGVVLIHFCPSLKSKIPQFLRLTTGLLGTAFIALGAFVFRYALFKITPIIAVASFSLALCGYLFGAAAAHAFRLSKQQVATISLETGFQNLGIALLMINVSLSSPSSDLASVVPICYTFLGALIPATAFLCRWCYLYNRSVEFKKDLDVVNSYQEIPRNEKEGKAKEVTTVENNKALDAGDAAETPKNGI